MRNWCIRAPLSSAHYVQNRQIGAISRHVGNGHAPVSYTHLDVYKRQALERHPPASRITSAHSLDGNRPHREGTVARYFMGTVEKPGWGRLHGAFTFAKLLSQEMKNRLSKSECPRSRQEAIRNREAPCTWTSTATPPSTASWRPSCGKASRAAPTPPARASPPSEGWRPIWAARATPSSRPTICSCRKATWRAAPAAGTSCRT